MRADGLVPGAGRGEDLAQTLSQESEILDGNVSVVWRLHEVSHARPLLAGQHGWKQSWAARFVVKTAALFFSLPRMVP